MTARDFDWDALRAMWIEHADRTVAHVAKKHPDETFYVLVFMLDEEVYGPQIAMQSLDGAEITKGKRAGRLDDAQWSPFEWGEREQIDVEANADENVRMYRAFGDYLKSGTREEWSAAHVRHDDVIVEAAREIAGRAARREGGFAKLRMVDDFVVFAREHDVRYPLLRARGSIEDALLERFFATELGEERERAEIAARPLPDRVEYLMSRLGKLGGIISSEVAREQLRAIGAPAVPALVAALEHPKHGNEAAMVLARMGPPDALPAVGALVAALSAKNQSAGLWAAKALGVLGQVDLLAERARVKKHAYHAVSGLADGLPAAYPHLSALLDEKQEELTKLIEDAISPGRSGYTPKAHDFATITAHASSKHPAIRKDVAIALRGPDRGAWPKAEAVVALVAMLDDKNADVRRLAALSLGELKADAIAAVDALRKLEKDRVKAVAQTATGALAEILWKPGDAD